MAKRGLNDLPVGERDYDPAFLMGNPSSKVGFLGVDGPQRGVAIAFGFIVALMGLGFIFF